MVSSQKQEAEKKTAPALCALFLRKRATSLHPLHHFYAPPQLWYTHFYHTLQILSDQHSL